MIKRTFHWIAAAVACVLSITSIAAQESWSWQQVAPGVVAALQPDEERFDDANVTFIDWGADGLIMVDAPAKAERLAELLGQLSERTDRQVRWIVNTHWHADHTQGNWQVLKVYPDAAVIGHVSHLEDVPGRAAKQIADRVERLEALLPEAREQLALGRDEEGKDLDAEGIARQTAGIERAEAWLSAHRDLRFVLPTVVVNDDLTLHDGDRSIKLYAFRAHTGGDLLVHLPDRGVLITGDVVDDLPYIGHGYPRSWIETLNTLAELEPAVIVPGHGPVFEGADQIITVRGFLDYLVREVEALMASAPPDQESDPKTLAEAIDFTPWRERFVRDEASGRFFSAVLAEAVGRAVADLQGFDDRDEAVSQ